MRGEFVKARHVLARERVVQCLAERGRRRLQFEQRREHARVAQVETHFGQTRETQRIEHQRLDFEIGFEAGVAVDLGADLDLLAGRVQSARTRVQHVARVTQARHALPVQQMRVDARDLRRNVGAQAERAARQLVDELEGAQVEIGAAARQQRFEILEHRRHHEFVAVRTETVEQPPAQFLDLAGFRRQHVGDILGK